MKEQRTYRDHVMSLSNAILSRYGSERLTGLPEALTVIATSIGETVMAGTGQTTDPRQCTVEKCSVSACFVAACTVPLISSLNEQGLQVDAESLMHQAGRRLYADFSEEDRRIIVDSGILLFKELNHAAGDNPKLQEWMESVYNVTNRYVLTEGSSDCVELFSPLYLVLLMATRQIEPGPPAGGGAQG